MAVRIFKGQAVHWSLILARTGDASAVVFGRLTDGIDFGAAAAAHAQQHFAAGLGIAQTLGGELRIEFRLQQHGENVVGNDDADGHFIAVLLVNAEAQCGKKLARTLDVADGEIHKNLTAHGASLVLVMDENAIVSRFLRQKKSTTGIVFLAGGRCRAERPPGVAYARALALAVKRMA